MPTGLSIPFRADGAGKLRKSRGKQHVAEVLSAAFGSGLSDNPFQSIGFGEEIVFDLANPQVFNDAKDKIIEIFEGMEKNQIAVLQDRTDNLVVYRTKEGEYAIMVFAVDLESDNEFAMSIAGGAGGWNVILK